MKRCAREEGKAMKRDFLLVDGYNIIHAWPDLMEMTEVSLESARQKLVEIMSNYQGYHSHLEVIIVFDGYLVNGNPGTAQRRHNVHVVYTKEAETADHYIEKVVHGLPRECRVRVATSDGLEQLIILGRGAVRMSASELLREVRLTNEAMREKFIAPPKAKKNVLMDHLDEQTREKLEKMRRNEW